MMQARKELAEKIDTSGLIVGHYARYDTMPSVFTTKISEALEVSLVFLLDKSFLPGKVKTCSNDWKIFPSSLPINKQNSFNLMDAYLRDYRTSKAYVEK